MLFLWCINLKKAFTWSDKNFVNKLKSSPVLDICFWVTPWWWDGSLSCARLRPRSTEFPTEFLSGLSSDCCNFSPLNVTAISPDSGDGRGSGLSRGQSPYPWKTSEYNILPVNEHNSFYVDSSMLFRHQQSIWWIVFEVWGGWPIVYR